MIKGKWETILDEIFFIQIESPDLDVELNRERAYTREGGGKLNDEVRRWRRGEIVEKSDDRPAYISPLVLFLIPRNVTDPGFNSLETWDESIFPGAIIVGAEAIYGEHTSKYKITKIYSWRRTNRSSLPRLFRTCPHLQL